MSEPILMALVQLFAIVAASGKKQLSDNARTIVSSFLEQHLNSVELEEYLKLFDELLFFHQPFEEQSGPATDASGKIRTICQKVSKELQSADRLIVTLRFLEFLGETTTDETKDVSEITELEAKYLEILKSSFNIPEQEFTDISAFILEPFAGKVHPEKMLVFNADPAESKSAHKHVLLEHLDGQLIVIHVHSINMFMCRYLGNDELFLNGHLVQPYRFFSFENGGILKNMKIRPVYYADIASRFLYTKEVIKTAFTVSEAEFYFRNSTNGIHPFSLTAGSGELIGIMGGSGVGKSTLLNLLNGNLDPVGGKILINGIDLKTEKEKLKGVIGFVPQDDLLVEELTVFQNLYFNARLCFSGFTERQLIRSVMKILSDIDLLAIKDLKVGDPLNKFISGGQRKRLNIALELIREPAVLFVDEPTSGLSSMDSEMVMLLLKEQTLKGKLVAVNIHQPSSDIYKLFDKLLIMDKGGYPIYYGNPIDALSYFKNISNYVNPNESECLSCGYVNPEQILQITEAKIINEYGKFTGNRKIGPKEWYDNFRRLIQPGLRIDEAKKELPHSFFKIPGKWKQFSIFSQRNFLSKITNRQYIVINLLEAPFLAALLAFLTRYSPGNDYHFGGNKNLVAYMFMSVVVALFLGMMVSAEEIIRDRRILKREAFLDLSRSSYLNSKILLLFGLSAIQMILYVLVGNWILGIKGMTFHYWLILFATSCFANMIGLNISSGLNSVVAIYILIPFIIVPQLLLSGTIVPFDNLNRAISSGKNVPFIGDMMTSRWTFEGLAVHQFRENRYEKIFYPCDQKISNYSYLTSYLVPSLESKIDECQRNMVEKKDPGTLDRTLRLLRNEITALQEEAGIGSFQYMTRLNRNSFSFDVADSARAFLEKLSQHFSSILNRCSSQRDAIYQECINQMGQNGLDDLRKDYYNDDLASLVLNATAENKIVESGDRLTRKKDPVFLEPTSRNGRSQFYAPVKNLSGWKIDTFWFDTAVIWLMSVFLYFTLLFDALRNAINYLSKLKFRSS